MRILFLSTWFPYPLSQGSKIRAYYLIRSLAQKHDVNLVSFAETPIDDLTLDHMKQICRNVDVVDENPFQPKRIKSILGWLSWKPGIAITSRSREMEERVRGIVRTWKPDRIVAITFVTAPYACSVSGVPKIIDIDNLMSPMLYESYQRSIHRQKRLRSWLAWKKFQIYEKWLYNQFDLCFAVSKQDLEKVSKLVLKGPELTGLLPNGVDLVLNHPGLCQPEPASLVFNGALTYSANFDAMNYFIDEIFPFIRARLPQAHLRITGKTAGASIAKFTTSPNITLTGYLQDVRPMVAGSWVCVAPLREGGGTRLKILEAMALGTPVVTTTKGAEGLEVEDGKHLLIADHAADFAERTLRVLQDSQLRTQLASNAYLLVKEKYDWVSIGKQFVRSVENVMSHE